MPRILVHAAQAFVSKQMQACNGLGAAPDMACAVQALSLETVGKLVKLGGPASIRPHLPELATALLESLSGLEVGQPAWLTVSALPACSCL